MVFHIKDIIGFFRHAMKFQFTKWSPYIFSDNKFTVSYNIKARRIHFTISK